MSSISVGNTDYLPTSESSPTSVVQYIETSEIATQNRPFDDSFKIGGGSYTREERIRLIEKFRAKKRRRIWRKQIKYDCRKRLADTRPRVKGRFVSREFDGVNMTCGDDGVVAEGNEVRNVIKRE